MSSQNDFLMSISALYRYTQKYFDKNMSDYNIGWGQLVFLLLIYENEGISMQQLSSMADCDKGTTTKSMKRLLDEGYVEIQSDDNDKRIKRLFSSEKARKIVNDLYRMRNDYTALLLKDKSEEEMEKEIADIGQIAENARAIMPEETYSSIKLGGIQKLTLLDYPGQVAATLFTVGCNMKCPFCHNRDLVFVPESMSYLDPDDVLDFFRKRQGILDAVAITGGEPLLQPGLADLLRQIKELGYKIKLDTNGLLPDRLKETVESGLVDYVAMDLKNTAEKYPATIGLPESPALIANLEKSISYLMESDIEYEFRTTVVREFHSPEDLKAIAERIKGAKHYYLQQFVDSGRCIREGLSAYTAEEMKGLLKEVQTIIPNAELRGV